MISMLMLPSVIARALCLGLIFGAMKIYGIAVLIYAFIFQSFASLLYYIEFWEKSKSFLGILTSFTSPCLIVKEQSIYFLVNGLVGTMAYIISLFNIWLFALDITSSTFILKCHNNYTADKVVRCPIINTTNAIDIEHCNQGLFYTTDEPHFTVCPSNYSEWHFLRIACIVAGVLLTLSFLCITILHTLIKEDSRIILLRKIYKKYEGSNDNGYTVMEQKSDYKTLFELQTQQGDLDLNMDLNTKLNLSQNTNLLILNYKKYFGKIENMKVPLMNLTRHDGDPEIIAIINQHLISTDNFHEKLLQSSIENVNLTIISYYIKHSARFPNLSLFEDECHLPVVSAVLEAFTGMEQEFMPAFKESNFAVISSYISTFQWLSQSPFSECICHYAIRNYNFIDIYKIIDKLPQLKDSNSPLIQFLASTDLRETTIKPEEVNIKLNDDLCTFPLHLAIKEGSLELVEVLLSKGASTEAKDIYEETALHKAVREGHQEIIENLIKNNCDIEAKNKTHLTPLHLASVLENETIPEILLRNKANPDSTNLWQETPLHVAAWNGKPKVIELLLKSGANKNLKNKDNATPLQKAPYYRRNQAVIDLLKQD